MNQREAFLKAIQENPLDGTTRKVFADWLDEHDEPELADFMRSWTVEKYEKSVVFLGHLLEEINRGIDDENQMARLVNIFSQVVADENEFDLRYNRQSMESLIQAGHNQIQKKGRGALPTGAWHYFSDHEDEYWEAWSILANTPLPKDHYPDVPFSCC